MWAGHSKGHKDGFYHLPTVDQWIRSAEDLKTLTHRALLWSLAEAAMNLSRQYGRDMDGSPRVAYNVKDDEPMFLVQGYDGSIYIACDCEGPITLD